MARKHLKYTPPSQGKRFFYDLFIFIGGIEATLSLVFLGLKLNELLLGRRVSEAPLFALWVFNMVLYVIEGVILFILFQLILLGLRKVWPRLNASDLALAIFFPFLGILSDLFIFSPQRNFMNWLQPPFTTVPAMIVSLALVFGMAYFSQLESEAM